ncbi:MAG: hypothetical protein ABFD98_03740 [Syntrophobacteraceae bacterium]
MPIVIAATTWREEENGQSPSDMAAFFPFQGMIPFLMMSNPVGCSILQAYNLLRDIGTSASRELWQNMRDDTGGDNPLKPQPKFSNSQDYNFSRFLFNRSM